MISRSRRWRALALVFACLALSCGGLPDALVENARRLDARIVEVGAEVDRKQAELAQVLARSDYAALEVYAEREDWQRRFSEARAELADARESFDQKVTPLLERDDEETVAALTGALKGVQDDVRRATTLAGEPARRAEYLKDVGERGPEMVAAARADLAAVVSTLSGVKARADTAAVDYPARGDDLTGRVAGIRSVEQTVRGALVRAEAELPRLATGEADLALIGDAVSEAESQTGIAKASLSDLSGRIDELYRSYSKTLIDMQERYVAVIGRTSWNEAFDFPAEHEYAYRRDVDAKTAAALAEWGDKTLASGRNTVHIPREIWDGLAINRTERMPRGDNAAEFWLSDIESRYFHRYLVVEGDRQRESDWEEVAEGLYEAHAENLGMDILAKPYGMYEDEVLTQAAPAGMAYVGDPKYGSWESDPQGRRYWSWGQNFLFYYLLFGGGGRHYYYQDDWNRWRGDYRGRQAYYGGTSGGSRRYGTAGSVTRESSRYAGSTFGRSGGFERQDRTFRSAGPGGRGGGSGGRGK